jgi:formylglycine-generating enzyme required for sulfatase activity
VSTFRLDKYEATVGRFRQFVTAWNGGGGWSPEAGSGKHKHLNGGSGLANSASPGTYETGWVMTDNGKVSPTSANLDCNRSSSTWTSEASTQENLPINCVNWYEAYAFCIWDGGFLPSEAEWEYAAGGGSQEREYPWGETDPGSGNQYAIYGCNYPSSSADCTRVTSIAPVGTPSAGAGVWGQLDLAGNVAELNLDWSAKYVKPCTDCAYLTRPLTSPSSNPDERVDHGGNYSYFASILQPPVRGTFPVARRYDFIGFRCARTP